MIGVLSFERRLDLDPHWVGFFLYSRDTGGVDGEPIRADYSDENIDLAKGLLDVGPEIGSEWDIVDVHEHRMLAVARSEAIKHTASDG